MPTTLQYRPRLIDELITNERINSYKNVFQPQTDIELMGVYLWNTHVCGTIYPLVCAAEITLRNSIDQALIQHLGTFWWSHTKLRYKSFVAGQKPPDLVERLKNNFSKATSIHIKDRRNRYKITGKIIPTHHGVIANTEFSTWEYILDDEFMGPSLIWPSRLGSVFSGPWPHQQTSNVLTYAKDLVSTIRNFRNRLFHHEPAWKRYGVSTETDAIQHLQEKIGKIEILIKLIHPEKHKLLQKNWLLENAYRACSSHEIKRFQHLAKTYNISSFSELSGLAETCIKENSIAKVKFFNSDNYPSIDGKDFLIIPT